MSNAKFKTYQQKQIMVSVSPSPSRKTAKLESFLKVFLCEYLKANAHIHVPERENVLGKY